MVSSTTPMSTFKVSSGGSALSVSNLTSPVSFLLAYQAYVAQSNSYHTHKCRKKHKENVTISCGGGVKL